MNTKLRHTTRRPGTRWHERWRPRFDKRPGPTVVSCPLEVRAVGQCFDFDPRALS